jgi:hypothetical protein
MHLIKPDKSMMVVFYLHQSHSFPSEKKKRKIAFQVVLATGSLALEFIELQHEEVWLPQATSQAQSFVQVSADLLPRTVTLKAQVLHSHST